MSVVTREVGGEPVLKLYIHLLVVNVLGPDINEPCPAGPCSTA